jgi:hypothetical protein
VTREQPTSNDLTPSLGPTRALLWLYFWLLIAEGALRKWALPQYSDVLFLVRDPVAVLCYLAALRARVWSWLPATAVVGLLAVLSLAAALCSETRLLVTLFGLRTNYLHLPLIFLMGAVLDRDDVRRFGHALVLLAVPIVLLMALQFNAPPSAWINAGVGGEGGTGQLIGALGRIRAPGPFSFIAALVMYFSLTVAFLLHGWLAGGKRGRLLAAVGTVALVVAVPLSISRSLLLGVLVPACFALLGVLRQPRRIAAVAGPVVVGAFVSAWLAESEYLEAFVTRWTDAESAGGGDFRSNILGRVLAEYTRPFEAALEAPLFGYGVGLGTLGGARLSTGERVFLLAEGELARCVLELGPILGFAFIAWRVWLAALLLGRAWHALATRGDLLPWLLAGTMALSIVSGQLGPATQLGFTVFGAGLALAALNPPAPPAPDAGDTTDTGESGDPAAAADGKEDEPAHLPPPPPATDRS